MASHPRTSETDKSDAGYAAERDVPDDMPMTDEQATLLKQLCDEANEPQAFDGELTKQEARDLIHEMRRKVGLPQ